MITAEPLQAAIEEFNKFPGIGRKTAQRLALTLLRKESHEVERFVETILDLKRKLRFCSVCFNLTEFEICSVCSSEKRDKTVVCVVEDIKDVFAIEKTNEYNGVYHILGGVLSPLSGIGQDELHIKELVTRIEQGIIKEVILAVNPDTEGEATSLFLAKLLKPLAVTVTRLARGLPIGGDLEFADDATIGRAVKGRVQL